MRPLLSNLLNISITLFVISFIYSVFNLTFNIPVYFIFFIITISLFSIFLVKSKSKKMYILIVLSFLCLFILSYLNTKYLTNVNTKNNSEISDDINKTNKNLVMGAEKEASTESLIQDIQIDIKNNIDKEIIKEKILYTIQKAEERKDKNLSISYLDLGHVYEIAFVSGYSEAGSKALESYNQYCLLEPNDANCYATVARFLIIDKNRKKEAIIFAKKALELSKDGQETENYNKLLNYIEKL